MSGLPAARANPLAAEMPMRMPVNEPGPVTAQKKSQSEGRRPASSMAAHASSMSSTDCLRAQSGRYFKEAFPPFTASAVRCFDAVSTAKNLFNFTHLPLFKGMPPRQYSMRRTFSPSFVIATLLQFSGKTSAMFSAHSTRQTPSP